MITQETKRISIVMVDNGFVVYSDSSDYSNGKPEYIAGDLPEVFETLGKLWK